MGSALAMGSDPLLRPNPLLRLEDFNAEGGSDPLGGGAVVLDARSGPNAREAYLEAHVRGARWVDLETELSAPTAHPEQGGRHPLPPIDTWCERLGSWGIGPETPVVIYDALGGGNAAARAWWMLRAIGHDRVQVVDGGWNTLVEVGASVVSSAASPITAWTPRKPYPASVTEWPVVDADFVERIRQDASWRLVDARAPERFLGLAEPYDPIAGHIAGAANLFWQQLLSEDMRFLPMDKVEKALSDVIGEVASDHVVCYCGSGVTACQLLLALTVCGQSGGHLYVGSWSEWCRNDRPRYP